MGPSREFYFTLLIWNTLKITKFKFSLFFSVKSFNIRVTFAIGASTCDPSRAFYFLVSTQPTRSSFLTHYTWITLCIYFNPSLHCVADLQHTSFYRIKKCMYRFFLNRSNVADSHDLCLNPLHDLCSLLSFVKVYFLPKAKFWFKTKFMWKLRIIDQCQSGFQRPKVEKIISA